MQRYQMLYDKKSVSPQEFDEVKTKLAAAKARRDAAHAGRAQAEAAVSQANTAVGFSSIRAPFDGLVTAKFVDAGAMAAPGVPLLIVEDPSHFRLEVQVDESQMGAVHLGATVPVVIDALGEQPISGKVVQIVPAADPASRSFTVKIELPSESADSLGTLRARAISARPAAIHSGPASRAGAPRPTGRGVRGGQRSDRQPALHHAGQTFRQRCRSALRARQRRADRRRCRRTRAERQTNWSAVTMPAEEKTPLRIAGMVAHAFINSKLTPLFIAGALLAGAFAILMTPREEEPQIVVPMLDVFVRMPGATPAEVQQRASIPMERLLREVPGVEYVYSISQPGMSMLVVRFYVGTKEEDAIIKVYNKLYSNFDRIPQGVSQPLIKVRSIDDVPIMALTLWGENYDSYQLRQIAGELEQQLKQIDDVSETKIIGGLPRQVRVVLDSQRLAAYGMTAGAVTAQLEQANARSSSGSFAQDNQEFQVEAGRFLGSAEDLKQVVVGVSQGKPVYLRDVASGDCRWPRRAGRLRLVCQCSRRSQEPRRAANFPQ